MPKKLNRDLPFGEIMNDKLGRRFEQGGVFFNGAGDEIVSQPKTLNRDEPYGEIINDRFGRHFEQGGVFFDRAGAEITAVIESPDPAAVLSPDALAIRTATKAAIAAQSAVAKVESPADAAGSGQLLAP